MKNAYVIFLFAFIALLFTACKKDKSQCVKVKYIMDYCPKPGASLVSLESKTGGSMQIALLNLPEAFQVGDKVFYVRYHYDQTLDNLDPTVYCPAIFGPTKIFVVDSANDTNCND